MLWDLGVRDPQPPCVRLEHGAARWSLDGRELRLARRGDVVVLDLPARRISLELVPLVELIQVIDWLVAS